MHGGVSEGQLRFGHSDQRDGLGRRDRDRQGRRVGHPDVLAGQNHQSAREESRILAGHQHAGQVVQGRIDVGAPDRLDEGADHVVVLVAVAVVAHRGLVQGLFDGLDRDGAVGCPGGLSGDLQGGQRPASIPGRQCDQQFHRVVGNRYRIAESAWIGDGPTDDRPNVGGAQRMQLQDQRAREQWGHHREGRILGGGRNE